MKLRNLIHTSFIVLLLLASSYLNAQDARFSGPYALSTPDESPAELEPELSLTLMAIAGGCKIADDPKTLKRREDPEAYIIDDYKKTLLSMSTYASELAGKTKNSDFQAVIKKVEKSIKKKKFAAALEQLQAAKVNVRTDIESLYFAWADYLYEKDKELPWLKPENRKVTRQFRKLITYAGNAKTRPFGAKAELGGVIADAAQALSNCMENPEDLSWKGKGKIQLQKEDELHRLAADVAYLDWRMHQPANGRRAYAIDRDQVIKIKQALYDVVAAMYRDGDNWFTDPHHGENLQALYNSTFGSAWKVDGSNAIKVSESKTTEINLNEDLPTQRKY